MRAMDYGKLIRAITSNMNHYIGSKIEKFGIKHGQFEYFLLISSSPGINQLELSKMKNVGKASVTKALKILEEGGYIKRLQDQKDKRNYLCYITEEGEHIIDELMQVSAFAQEGIFNGFTDQDKLRLYQYLEQMHLNSSTLVEGLEPMEVE